MVGQTMNKNYRSSMNIVTEILIARITKVTSNPKSYFYHCVLHGMIEKSDIGNFKKLMGFIMSAPFR